MVVTSDFVCHVNEGFLMVMSISYLSVCKDTAVVWRLYPITRMIGLN